MALLIIFFFGILGSPGWADSRCEWAQCSPGTPAASSWTVEQGNGGASVCGVGDKAACAEQCRREFDAKYKRCVETCLGGRCVQPTPVPSKGPEQSIGSPCVEIESPACQEQCVTESSGKQPRCRRDCLQRACPDASQLDIAKESLDPGTFRCERCKQQYAISCGRQCALGMLGTFPGIERWGCEKACVISYCSKSCGRLSLVP